MSPIVDWGQAKEFEPLAKGRYPSRFTSREWKDGAKGPYAAAVFTVDEGEFAGRKLFKNMSLAAGALFGTKRDLIAMGADARDVSPGSTKDVDDVMEELIGEPCELDVDVYSYTDPNKSDDDETKTTLRNEIKRIIPTAVRV